MIRAIRELWQRITGREHQRQQYIYSTPVGRSGLCPICKTLWDDLGEHMDTFHPGRT